jgi:hypothetical protein
MREVAMAQTAAPPAGERDVAAQVTSIVMVTRAGATASSVMRRIIDNG